MSASAVVNFNGASTSGDSKPSARQNNVSSSAASGGSSNKPGASTSNKVASLILPNEFLSTRLLTCRVIVFLTAHSIEIEGTLLEVQEDDTLLLGQAVVLKNPTRGCTTLQREVIDRFPKMAVHGKYVAMVSLKPRGDNDAAE
ncbi:Hypothetical protein, putative [Bodo saltans]|uniref:Uncharacterized protein n=1 Tax=Bodo saltans TaxID=75058 RepID=A0A0S4IKR4_BODSA|nr:Hypothetical protein, putative [Bodo saltans]|eukprot:CUF12669.1 Hypothetical protein, putative [Bodo saltans]